MSDSASLLVVCSTGTGVFTNTAGLQKLMDIIQVGDCFNYWGVSVSGSDTKDFREWPKVLITHV